MNILRFAFHQSGKTCLSNTQIFSQFMQIHTIPSHLAKKLVSTHQDADKINTAVLMVYTGGPKCEDDIECFCNRVIMDDFLSYGAKTRELKKTDVPRILPRMMTKYESLGNKTPQFGWMQIQASLLEKRLDTMCMDTAPHRAIIGCQFVRPSIPDALREIHALPCVKNILVLPMYPQYSCGLTGGCFNAIFKFYKQHPLLEGVSWAVVDNWATTYSLIKNTAYLIKSAYVNCRRRQPKCPFQLIFAGRPMPKQVFDVGDFYPYLVGVTAMNIVRIIQDSMDLPYTIAWHDGPHLEKWTEPTVEQVIKDLVCKGHKLFMLVPISTITENLVTYYDWDINIQKYLLPKLGKDIQLIRLPAPNSSDLFITSVAQTCKEALVGRKLPSHLQEMCISCRNPWCMRYKRWLRKLLTDRRINIKEMKEKRPWK